MKTHEINRRDFLKMGVMALGGASLAACAPATTQAPAEVAPTAESEQPAAEAPSGEGKTITWWFAWGNLPAAVDKMMETQEFKTLIGANKFEYKGSVNTEAITTAIAAGTPPDGGSNFDYPNLFYRGALLPVDDLVAASTYIKKDDILEGLWNSAFYDNKMIGVPGIEGYLWWGMDYNNKAAEDAGLDTSNPPLTWEEAYEWHKALTKFDAAGNVQQFGLDPYDAMAGEPDFGVQSFGGKNWWDEAARKIDLNNDIVAEWFETCGEFIKLVGPDKFAGLRQDQNLGGWGAAFNAGVQTMIMEGYWHPGETQIQKPEVAQYNRATWAPVPASRKGAKIMATGAHFVVLFNGAQNPNEMYKVAEFLITDVAQNIIFKEVGWIFGRKSWLTQIDKNTYPGLDFYIDAASQVTEWIVGRRCPIHWYITNQCAELRERVFRGEMDGKAAAAEVQSRAETEWAAQGLK